MKRKICFLFCISSCLLLSNLSLVLADNSILIAYTNDRHGYIQPFSHPATGLELGGAAWEASLLKSLRKNARQERTPILLVDAGDLFQGTPVVNATKGKCMIDVFNALGYHIATFGNHEFDYGPDVLKQRMEESRFLWVSSNVEAPALAGKYIPYVTYDLSGSRIAFLAVTTPTTPNITFKHNVEGIRFHEPIEVLPPLIKGLRQEHGVDVCILLSHMGYSGDEWLARRMSGIDLIIGGHSHTRLLEPVKIRNTWIVQAACHSRYVGLARLSLDEKGNLNTVTSALREVNHELYDPDPEVAEIVAGYTEVLDKKLDEIMGTATADIERGFSGIDSPAGIICADSYRFVADTEIGIMNVGGVRASIPAGPVSMRKLLLLSPFANTIVRMRLKGAAIKNLLERSVAGIWHDIPEDKKELWKEAGKGKIAGKVPGKGNVGFLVGAGLEYAFDSSYPPGQRIMSVKVCGKDLQAEKSYTVALNSFLAYGGDGFTEFAQGEELVDTGTVDADALRIYFQKKGQVAPPDYVSAKNLTVEMKSAAIK